MRLIWIFLLTVTTALASDGTQSEPIHPGDASTLVQLVESFFRTETPEDRRTLIGKIDAAADGSIAAVVDALGHPRLWEAPEDNGGTFPFVSASGEKIEIGYLLPSDYDPTARYPSVICMPGRGWDHKDCIYFTGGLVGESTDDEFIILCPSRPIDAAFAREVPQSDVFRRFLREVRRRLHLDTDRTFLWGKDTGGDAAWIAAVAHPHEFAGAIFVSSYLRVPYPEQLYPLLLGNLRSLPVLTVWHEAYESADSLRTRAVPVHNRAAVALVSRAGLPIRALELSQDQPEHEEALLKEIGTILAHRRDRSARHISHWFRYPDQGDTGWVRLAKFKGDAWEEEQLSILPSPLTDRDEYITAVLEEKLGYIGATVQGQTINIETRKCGKIDILFPLGLVDLEKPVTIYCNGRRRHQGPVRSSIRTLLETTYDTWDFQRLTPARLSLSIKSDRDD